MRVSVNFQWGKTVPTMNVTLKPYSVTDKNVLANWPGSEAAAFLDKTCLKRCAQYRLVIHYPNVSLYIQRCATRKAK